ncbi:putative salt-induced outer membrane protein YdiY [Halospina denitrificans]|uniref:Putative salt-induced outer membrane protein YdiY n=1 Tax=Halospina denitrificans TaxID=332522 RepID=A0A4R7JHV9_9GAMM|nr:DUF481 domain-containing protein [Halospina denitrificans]TDT37064.1 putative salt-induced outer membrane protein YdiY [Halospina denitrificans]
MVKRIRALAGALLMMGMTLPAVAQEGWSGDVEGGLVTTSGNTDETSISGEADITRDWMDWRQNVLLQSRYTEQNDERSAERYTASTQLDYKFNPNDFVFIRARYDNDDFSGYQFQASTTAGYGRRIWEQGGSHFDTSVGAGYRYSKFEQRDPEQGSKREEPIARLAVDFLYELSETAKFREELESEIGVDEGDSVSRSVTSLQANINSSVAMRFSYTVEHDSNPPSDSKNTDTISAVTVLYNF